MKKFLFVLLALTLLLTACSNQGPQETSAPTTEPTEPPGTYIEGNVIEQQTQGAIRVFDPEGTYTMLSAIGDQLLLISDGETSSLKLLNGDRRVITATAELDFHILDTTFQSIYSGFVYYDAKTREAVYLNPQLQESERIKLPEDMQGYPAFSSDGDEIFYCAGQEIRALDVEQGFSRLIKSHTCAYQELLDTHFDGKVLVCRVTSEAGENNTVYISSENGQTLRTDNTITHISTYEDAYFVRRTDGGVTQNLFGTMDQYPGQQLNLDGAAVSALELGGLIYCKEIDENNLQLDFYDTASGLKTSSVTIPASVIPIAFLTDRWSGSIWFLTEAGDNQKLMCWNVKKTSVEDPQIYTSVACTAQTPDEAALEICQERAEELENTHDVDIRIWQDAVKYTGGYTVEAEYQKVAIQNCLDALDDAMSILPEDFLRKSVNNRIRICIVRSVSGKTDAVLHWYDGDPFIMMPAMAEDIQMAFWEQLSYVVDIHVLGNSPMYDYWNDLNPEGFVYGDESTYKEEYWSGEKMAFFSRDAMNSAPDDRSLIFLQAIQPGNEEIFKNETMQQKLLLLCQAIRDAWRWEKKTDTYLWEQYLLEPIAYQK